MIRANSGHESPIFIATTVDGKDALLSLPELVEGVRVGSVSVEPGVMVMGAAGPARNINREEIDTINQAAAQPPAETGQAS